MSPNGSGGITTILPADIVTDAGYRRLVIWLAVGTLYSGLSLYLFASERSEVPPLFVILAIAMLALPLALLRGGLTAVVSAPLFVWSCGYFALSVPAYLLSSRSELAAQDLRNRTLCCLLLAAFLLLFNSDDAARTARRAMLWSALVLGVGLNLYEVVAPLTFSPIFGRSAGLYLNPNISASVLAATALLTLEDVLPKWRVRVLTLFTLGILVTLSRSVILAWLPLLVALGFGRVVDGRRLGLTLVATLAIAGTVLASTGLLGVAWELYQRGGAEAVARFTSPFDLGANAEQSASERFGALQLAFRMFTEHPIWGSGLASTWEWTYATRPHNMYAMHLAEQGILGLLLYPAAVGAAAVGTLEPRRGVVLAALLFLWLGMFSHNMLETFPLLMLLALVGRRRGTPVGESVVHH